METFDGLKNVYMTYTIKRIPQTAEKRLNPKAGIMNLSQFSVVFGLATEGPLGGWAFGGTVAIGIAVAMFCLFIVTTIKSFRFCLTG